MNRENSNMFYLALVITGLYLAGCATESRSIGLGGAIGAGTGAVLGGIVDPGKHGEYRTRNVIVGAAVGGMAGMVAGSVIHENTEKKEREAFLKGQASAPPPQAGAMPSLKPAQVRTEWIEGHKVGNTRWVDGHFEYVIDQPAQWDN